MTADADDIQFPACPKCGATDNPDRCEDCDLCNDCCDKNGCPAFPAPD